MNKRTDAITDLLGEFLAGLFAALAFAALIFWAGGGL